MSGRGKGAGQAGGLDEHRPALDCVVCGACCCNTEGNRAEGFVDYVEVFPSDALRRRRDLITRLGVRNERGQVHLKLDVDGRCVALSGVVGQSVHCTIYDLRPAVCRRVQAGSDECRRARRERGVDG
ncbi:MAG: YkgJ family cysteine cluster protein [Deltaproteobacteria bacterium]|nr:YkgJ family cysteine cluster protein [Deltaproteobacteria bacterium]